MNVRIVCLNHPVNSLNPTACGVWIMFSARKLFLKNNFYLFLKRKKKKSGLEFLSFQITVGPRKTSFVFKQS